VGRTAVKRFTTATIVVLISTTASTHFGVTTVVAWPCTVSPELAAGSAVVCASPQASNASPRITYADDPQTGETVMTVEF
jgi:hypothetical protein